MKKNYKWLLLVLVFGSCVTWLARDSRPDDEALIARFKAHKASYEQLRDLLQQDQQVSRVADWGVVPNGSVSPERHKRYLELLAQAEAFGASRNAGADAHPCILVWADGFAGDARHASICWLPAGPEIAPNSKISGDTVTTQYNPRYKPRTSKHIEEHWYLDRDS